MELKIASYDALELLETYYTDFNWPVTPRDFQIANMYSISNGGDGSYSMVWDLIDLENKKLFKASDFYDAENGGFTPDGEEYSEEWDAIEEKTNTHGTKIPTVISVETLLTAVIVSQLNKRGHNRSLGKTSEGWDKFKDDENEAFDENCEACTEDID